MTGGSGQDRDIFESRPSGQHPSSREMEPVGDDDDPLLHICPRLLQTLGGVGQVLPGVVGLILQQDILDRKSTRLNSSH